MNYVAVKKIFNGVCSHPWSGHMWIYPSPIILQWLPTMSVVIDSLAGVIRYRGVFCRIWRISAQNHPEEPDLSISFDQSTTYCNVHFLKSSTVTGLPVKRQLSIINSAPNKLIITLERCNMRLRYSYDGVYMCDEWLHMVKQWDAQHFERWFVYVNRSSYKCIGGTLARWYAGVWSEQRTRSWSTVYAQWSHNKRILVR